MSKKIKIRLDTMTESIKNIKTFAWAFLFGLLTSLKTDWPAVVFTLSIMPLVFTTRSTMNLSIVMLIK